MLLVPRRLRRAGMTGDVPYYGGRLSPAQAYAASHPSAPVSGPPAGSTGDQADALLSLQHLLDAGVITPEEYTGLRARLGA
ncbi:MAG: SHOCT domain-containing protein [Mycobacteriales bacterium]